MIDYDHIRTYSFYWNENKLVIREPIIADHVFIDKLESLNGIDKVFYLVPKLIISFNGSSYIREDFIGTINRSVLRDLISLINEFECILKQIDSDLLYRNIWKMNNGSFSNFREYESLPIDKYLKFVSIHNQETSLIKARMES